MPMKKTFLVLFILVLWMTTTGISFAAPTPALKADTPLPKEVNIVAPGPDVAPGLAAFFGTWVGTWKWDYYPDKVQVKRDTVIIVEKIEGDKVHMVFSWGDLRPYYRSSTVGWFRTAGIYQPETGKVAISIKEPMSLIPHTATFWINPEGKMEGYRKKLFSDASDYKAIYTKQQ